MSFQRGGDAHLDAGMLKGQIGDDPGQVALQMDPQGEEVRKHHDAVNSATGQARYGPGEIGLTELEEGRFDVVEGPRASQFGSDLSHALIGVFDAGPVRKDNQAGTHALPLI
jgi:hypothetical protein